MKIVSVIVLMLATACAFAPSSTNGPAITNPNTQQASPEMQQSTTVNAPQNSPISSGNTPEMTTASTSGTPNALWVKVLSPKDGATVTTPTVKVIGQAPAETVVTINDEIILVPQSQTFEQKISLQKGSNLIEVLASDMSGNEVYVPLTVVYNP